MNRTACASLFVLALALGLAVSASACSSDLFHDTSWPSACDLDPTTPGCPAAGASQDAGEGGSDADAGEAADGTAD